MDGDGDFSSVNMSQDVGPNMIPAPFGMIDSRANGGGKYKKSKKKKGKKK